MKHLPHILVVAVAAFLFPAFAQAAEARKPNIVLIYADDLGFGDIGANGATALKTPHIDRLAREGLNFTDGHSTSATCTPSRYALLTGEYPWRKKGTGILPGDAALIIEPGRPTLPSTLRDAGYTTGVVGKWHLGLGSVDKPADWNGDVKPGPLEIGFDHSFIMAATGDRVPCVYVENHRVVGLDPADPIKVDYQQKIGTEPTGKENPEQLKVKLTKGHDMTIINGVSRIGWMTGGKSARWVDEDMGDDFAKQAVKFVETNKEKPFFLFFGLHEPHVPRVPHARFVGTSGMGPRGDAIHALDWAVGEVLAALDKHNLTNDTLVIFTSDNGPVLDDGYADEAVEKLGDHKPAGPYRGGKYTPYEAGTRVPFIVRYPAKVKPGTKSDALVCQIDFMASFAAMTGKPLPTGAGPDSEDVMAALLGESPKGRKVLVEQGRRMSIREGNWKFIEPANPKGEGELFDLATDIGEQENLAGEKPEEAKRLAADLAKAMKPSGNPAR